MLISFLLERPFWYTCNSYFWVAATPFFLAEVSSLNKILLPAHLLEIEIGRFTWQQREHLYCQACRRSMGSNVLGDEAYSLSVCVRASDQRQQAFNRIQYWLELFMLKTFASHTFLITACAIQTKKTLAWKHVATVTAALRHVRAICTQWTGHTRLYPWQAAGTLEEETCEIFHPGSGEISPQVYEKNQRNMPQATAIEISDDSDKVRILGWNLSSLSLWASELSCINISICRFFVQYSQGCAQLLEYS